MIRIDPLSKLYANVCKVTDVEKRNSSEAYSEMSYN